MLIPICWVLAHVVNTAIFEPISWHRTLPWLALLGGLYAARTMMLALSDYLAGMGAVRVMSILRKDIIKGLYGVLPQRGMTQTTGEILSTIGEGVAALQPYYAQYLPARATMVFLPVAVLMIVYPVDWISGLIMSVTAPMIPFFMILIGRGTEKLNQKQWKRLSTLGSHFLEAVQGIVTLKLLNASRREALLLTSSGEAFRRETIAVLRVAFLSSLALEFFATISIALVAVLVGFRLLWGDIPFERGFLVLLLVPEFYLPLRRMGVHYHARMGAIAAAEKLDALLKLPPLPQGHRPWRASIPPEIRFRDVSFAYVDREASLEHINLELVAGGKTVVVGPSGSGKSTLLALVLGYIQPRSGHIIVNGQDLADIDLANWHAGLSYISQRPKLFAGSVMEAIRLGNPEARDNEILTLAEELGIADIVHTRQIAEDGRGLSGGQIQRVAFARALIRRAALLVLDEPTAQTDKVSIALQMNALKKHAQGRTIFMAAHHLETILDADRIYVLEKGCVVASGTHESLMQSSDYYRRCIQLMDTDGTIEGGVRS